MAHQDILTHEGDVMGKKTGHNVRQAVPFFWVQDMQRSLAFYVNNLGFNMEKKWIVDDRIRWCWLELGEASLMLQEFDERGEHTMPIGALGQGVEICFICQDALTIYQDAQDKEIEFSRPFVGNGMWVTEISDPDGYKLLFESPTDVPEETVHKGTEE